MFLSQFFSRRTVRSTRRPVASRRFQVEALEGRQLLSGIQGNHIGVAMRARPAHIGVAMIQGNHIGYEMIQGNHIGTNVV